MARSRFTLSDIFVLLIAIFAVRFVMLFMGVYIMRFPLIDEILAPLVYSLQARL